MTCSPCARSAFIKRVPTRPNQDDREEHHFQLLSIPRLRHAEEAVSASPVAKVLGGGGFMTLQVFRDYEAIA